MTLPEFLEKLAQTPRTWELRNCGKAIRCGDLRRPQCPVSYFTGDVSWCYPIAAKSLGIDELLSHQIAEAADALFGKYDRELRAKLLKACGLEGA